MFWLPIIGIGALAYFLTREGCLSDEALSKVRLELLDWQTRLTSAMTVVTDSTLLTEWDALKAELASVITLAENAKTTATALKFAMLDPTCVVGESSKNTIAKCAAFADKIQMPQPDKPWEWQDYAKWGLIIGGGYLAYRSMFGGKPLAELFGGGGEYPKSKLPRYAGGRRKLMKSGSRSS